MRSSQACPSLLAALGVLARWGVAPSASTAPAGSPGASPARWKGKEGIRSAGGSCDFGVGVGDGGGAATGAAAGARR